MRILCPFCGDRDTQEFVFRGEAPQNYPHLGADEDTIFKHVYLRENPAGATSEHWYHAQGCRNWLTVERDTLTHEIYEVRLAAEDRA